MFKQIIKLATESQIYNIGRGTCLAAAGQEWKKKDNLKKGDPTAKELALGLFNSKEKNLHESKHITTEN